MRGAAVIVIVCAGAAGCDQAQPAASAPRPGRVDVYYHPVGRSDDVSREQPNDRAALLEWPRDRCQPEHNYPLLRPGLDDGRRQRYAAQLCARSPWPDRPLAY